MRRARGAEKFSSPARKTFFDSIGQKPTVITYRHRRPVYLRQRNRYCLERLAARTEADQKAILRQASDAEFEKCVTHAHMKIRAEAREERAGKRVETACRRAELTRPKSGRGDAFTASICAAPAVRTSSPAKSEVKSRRPAAAKPGVREVMETA